MSKEGTVKKMKDEGVRIYVSRETHTKIKVQAAKENMKMFEFIDKMIDEYREKK